MPHSIARNRYWLSFDVGLTSSYENLYAWLDDHQAQECGDNIATFFHVKSFDSLAQELVRVVQKDNARATRLYLIGRTKENVYRGRFILGKRKANQRQGFGSVPSGGQEDTE